MDPCDFPWYKAFSGQCAIVGSLAGAIAAAVLTGAPLTFLGAAWAGVGAIVGALIAYCACRMSARRLPKIMPGETTVPGIVTDVGRAFTVFPFGDGDYLFNIKCVRRSFLDTKNDGGPACVRTKSDGTEYLHCEITSNVTQYGCAGAITGAAIAAPAGIALGTAAGVATAAACLALGIFAPLCLIAALIVALLVSGAVTGAGALAGGAIGSAAGLAADEAENQVGQAGADVLRPGDAVVFSGDWVTDADHNWNEIHDIIQAMIIDRDIKDCPTAGKLIGAIATGLRTHPDTPA